MSEATGHEAPRTPRGASSWARRFNDGTLEILAALARLGAIVGTLAEVSTLIGAAWAHGPTSAARFGVTAFLVAAWTFGCIWLGFVQLGNPEWKEGRRGPDAP